MPLRKPLTSTPLPSAVLALATGPTTLPMSVAWAFGKSPKQASVSATRAKTLGHRGERLIESLRVALNVTILWEVCFFIIGFFLILFLRPHEDVKQRADSARSSLL